MAGLKEGVAVSPGRPNQIFEYRIIFPVSALAAGNPRFLIRLTSGENRAAQQIFPNRTWIKGAEDFFALTIGPVGSFSV